MLDKNRILAEKREYVAIDFGRFFFAFCIMAIHLMPFVDVSVPLNYWVTQVLARAGVPFYFLVSGYFVATKLGDKKKLWQYIGRIMVLNVFYTLVYRNSIYRNYDSIWLFLKDFFLVGSILQLWYFWALIVATLLLALMVVALKWSDKVILCVSAILYALGVLGNAYLSQMQPNPRILVAYNQMFSTTRNGLFFGLFFVAVGYVIRKNASRIYKLPYWAMALAGFGLLNLEVYLFMHGNSQSLLFMLPFTVIPLFLELAFMRLPEKLVVVGKTLREWAVLLYAWHMYVYVTYGVALSGGEPTNGLPFSLMIIKRTFIIALVIWGISKIKWKPFCWLRYLY